MKYYSLKYSLDNKITGIDSRQIIDLYNQNNLKKNEIDSYQENRIGFIDGNEIDMNNFMLDSNANYTDILSSYLLSLDGMFISKKLKQVIKNSNFSDIKFFDVTIYKNEKANSDDYCFLNRISSKLIDYSESVFIIDKRLKLLRKGGKKISILNDDDYKEKLSNLVLTKPSYSIIPQKIVLLNELDIFYMLSVSDIICSEKLKNKIEEEGLTGLEFTESDIEFYVEE